MKAIRKKPKASTPHSDEPLKAEQPASRLVTAGGRINCRRCTARSKRTNRQCRRPALSASRTAKCQFHGGRSTGPKTSEGRKAIAQAHLRDGTETRAVRAIRAAHGAALRQIEDIARLIGMVRGPRMRGRKPRGYTPITSLDAALRYRDCHPVPPMWPVYRQRP